MRKSSKLTAYAERNKEWLAKTFLAHRRDDDRLIAWIDRQRNASEAIRRAIYHEIEREESGQPEINTGFSSAPQTATVDPESLRQALNEHLADVRAVVEAALRSAGGGAASEPGADREIDSERGNYLAQLDLIDIDV